MKTLVESRFASVSFNAEKRILFLRWDQEVKEFLKNEFISEFTAVVETAGKLKTDKFLLDLSGMENYFPIELQTFRFDDLLPLLSNLKIKRLAVILPDNIFTRILLEASCLSIVESRLNMNYFRTAEEAERWLISG